MLRNVDISSYHAVNRVREIEFSRAVGSSGTFIALAEMCAARRGDHNASYLAFKELRELMPTVQSRDLVGRYTIPGLEGGGALAVRQCAMFLKITDVSDRHRNHTVTKIHLSRSEGAVTLELVSDSNPFMEMWSLEKIRPDFRKLFGLDMVPVYSASSGAEAK